MDELPPATTPRFWIAFTALCIAFALSVVMATCTQARAQGMVCPPTEPLLKQLAEVHKERPVWGGVISTDDTAMEAIMFQSEKGGWTFILIRPDGRSCILAAGKDAAPSIEGPKGKGA